MRVLLDTVRRTVAATLPAAPATVPELIPFDPKAKKALELTFREALRMGHNYTLTRRVPRQAHGRPKVQPRIRLRCYATCRSK
jgi:hypothetical protein